MIEQRGIFIHLCSKFYKIFEKSMAKVMWLLYLSSMVCSNILLIIVYYSLGQSSSCTFPETNILVLTCKCGNIWKCRCLKQDKYEVKLSDFDSVCAVEHNGDPRLLPHFCCRAKTGLEWECDTGTPGCRAPEVRVAILYSV